MPLSAVQRRRLRSASRLLGLALVALLVVRHSDRVADGFAILGGGDPVLWLAAATLQLASLWMSAARLSRLLSLVSCPVGTLSLFADLIKATAINAALLMGVGDVYRVKRVNEHARSVALASSVVVLDRLLGLAMVGAVAALASLLLARKNDLVHFDLSLPLAFAALAAAAALLLFLRGRAPAVLRDLRRPFAVLATRPAALASVLLLSLAVVALWILGLIAVARALELEVAPLALAFAAPLVTIATLLPISIGGIGIREAGYALLLVPYGLTTAEAIALGIAQYTLFLPIIGAGAFLLWREGGLRRLRETAAGSE